MAIVTDASGNLHTWMFWKRKRYILVFLIFLGLLNVYILRVNLSMAVVAMTSPYNVTLDNGTVVEKQDFYWDSKDKGFLLSSFFYGYICTNLLGGWLGARVGGSRLFGLGVGVTALLTTLTPPVANTSFHLLLIIRVIEGLFEGVTFPCIYAVYAQWAPPTERTTMVAVAFSGAPMGTVVGLQASALVGSVLGWSGIFYVTGAVGLVWCVVWFTVARDCPEDDPNISSEELKYIKDSLGNIDSQTIKVSHPWKRIFTSMQFWAIVIVDFCSMWSHYTLLTQLPMFLRDTFSYQLAESGLLSSLPYIVTAVTTQVGGVISDWLRKRNFLTTGQVRKMFVCGPLLLQAVVLTLTGHLQGAVGVILCLIIDIGMEGFLIPSFCTNMIDIGDEHASILMGFSNTIATLPGVISPILTGYIVTDKSVEQWRVVFYITSAMCVLGALVFGAFASGERQPWATHETSPEDKRDIKVEQSGCVDDK